MHGRRHPSLRPSGVDPVPDRKASDATPTFTDSPLPRHRGIRVHPSLAASRAAHPSNYGQHDDDLDLTAADHDNNGTSSPFDDDRSRTSGANVSPTAGHARSDAMPTGDRGPDSRVLGPVRPRNSAMGDRDRLARVELPSRRGEPHWLLLDLPNGTPLTQGDLRGGRVSRLVRSTVRCARINRSGRSPLCVCGTFALALVIWTLILGWVF